MKERCVKYGDNISTDAIIAGKYTKTLVLEDLAQHCMEDLDKRFHDKVNAGCRIIVAGSYFGCGSSREQAPLALKLSGVQCIIAKSFSRIFYRNAVNIGLPIVECDTDDIQDGDLLEFSLGGDCVANLSRGKAYPVAKLPPIMVEILNDGGIERHFARKGGF